jgi:ribosomal-protein-alanine N-acetyltransferase
MLEFKTISDKDLDEVIKLHREYVDENIKSEEIKKIYEKYPDLFVGCYLDGKLVGICIPDILRGELYLKSIAVKHEYWRKGIGSKLLSLFEERLKRRGIKRISVGSAPINWVERFYLKHGYKPIRILVRLKVSNLPKNYSNAGLEIVDSRVEGDHKIIYINEKRYDPEIRERVKKVLNAEEALYIFEKTL